MYNTFGVGYHITTITTLNPVCYLIRYITEEKKQFVIMMHHKEKISTIEIAEKQFKNISNIRRKEQETGLKQVRSVYVR
jgi:hypothetical protein